MSAIKAGRGPRPKRIKAAVALKPTKMAKLARRAHMGLSKMKPMSGDLPQIPAPGDAE